jgi:hypothetical protein
MSFRWGAFELISTGEALHLRDPDNQQWRVALCNEVTPLLLNWYWVNRYFAGCSHATSQTPARTRRRLSEAAAREDHQWFETSRRFADRLRRAADLQIPPQSNQNKALAVELLSVVDKIERLWTEMWRSGIVQDCGVAECWIKCPRDPHKLSWLYFTTSLWAFDRFRRACDEVEFLHSSLHTALEFLLREIPESFDGYVFVEDPETLAKRIARLESDHLRVDAFNRLIEAVLRQVTTQGPFQPDGTARRSFCD